MISQTSLVSSEASFERQKKRKGRCSCSNTVISYGKRMIPFVRDFPKGCGPRGGFATRCSQHLVQSETSSFSSFYYSSESEDLVVPLPDNSLESVSSKEVERKDVLQALDTKDPTDLLETSDHEAKELPEKVLSGIRPQGYSPHKRVLAIRDYFSPSGRFQAPFFEDLVQSKVPDSSSCYDSEFEDLMVYTPHKKVLAIRDYPNPPERFQTPLSEDLIQSKVPDSNLCYDSEFDDLMVYTPHKRVLAIRDYPSPSGRFQSRFSKDLVQAKVPDSSLCYDSEFEDLMVYTPHKRVLAIRDYPSPPGRFETQFSEDLVQSEEPDSSPCYGSEFEDLMVYFLENNGLESIKSTEEETLDDNELIDLEETSEYEAKELSEEAELEFSSSSYDLESEDSIISMYNISLNSFGLSEEEEEEGIDMAKVIDFMGLMDQSQTLEPKSTDLTEETSSNFMPPILRPNTIDSTTTDFPKGCRRRGPQIREEDILESTTFETKGLNNKLSHAEDPLLEVLSDSEESCSTNSCKSKLKESENLSSQCSNQFSEKGPSTTENQVPKVPKQIVIALMAAPNCGESKEKSF